MAWELLPVNYTDAVWSGLKRYNEINNADGTVSFQDVTLYTGKEKSFFGARDANRMNEALNTIMNMVENGTDLYEAFQNYFDEQKTLFENQYNTYLEAMQTEGDAEIEKIKTEYRTEITNFENTQEAVFNQWFDLIKGQLGTDAAGNLQNQINDLNTKVDELEADLPNAGGARFTVNLTYDPDVTYTNCSYKLTVGAVERQGTFTSADLTITETGVIAVGTATFELTYTATVDGETETNTDTFTVDAPYFGVFTVDAALGGGAFNYKLWLRRIGKDTSGYASLTAVLADEPLVRELMTRHASCDYLATKCNLHTDIQAFTADRIAMKWIGLRDYVCDKLMAIPAWKTAMLESEHWQYILKDHVPTMTSDTAPEGTASASSIYSYPFPVFKVFDGEDSTYWASTVGAGNNSYIDYTFTEAFTANRVFLKWSRNNESGYSGIEFKIQAKNNDDTYIDLTSVVTITQSQYANGYEYEFDNSTAYSTYRLLITKCNELGGNQAFASRLQYYGRFADGDTSEYEFGDTSIEMIYDHGIEFKTMTAKKGVAAGGSGTPTAEKTADGLHYQLVSATNTGAWFTSDNIDITPYKTLYGEIDRSQPYKTNYNYGALGVSSNGTVVTMSASKSIGSSPFEPKVNVDVSSINTSLKVVFGFPSNVSSSVTMTATIGAIYLKK